MRNQLASLRGRSYPSHMSGCGVQSRPFYTPCLTVCAWSWTGLVLFTLIASFGLLGIPQIFDRFIPIRDAHVPRWGTAVVTIGGAAGTRLLHPGLARIGLAIPTRTQTVPVPWRASIPGSSPSGAWMGGRARGLPEGPVSATSWCISRMPGVDRSEHGWDVGPHKEIYT